MLRFRARMIFSAAMFIACIVPVVAQEFVVEPSTRVTQHVNIRSDVTAESDVIGQLAPGESLPFTDSVPRWYEVALPDGRKGFVSKSWTVVSPVRPPADLAVLRIHHLSVGAGTCTVVECPGDGAPPMIVDCGSTGGRTAGVGLEEDEAKARVQSILADHAAAPNVVLSHPDADHYSWIPSILEGVQVASIWQGGDVAEYTLGSFGAWISQQVAGGAKVHKGFPPTFNSESMPIDEDLKCGLASAHILAANVVGSRNTNSIVLMLTYYDFSAIFPGDAVGITEEQAIANFHGAVRANLLSTSHHGAATHGSNSQEWADATSPNVLIHSAGQKFGHPRCDATARYESSLAAAPQHETQCGVSNAYGERRVIQLSLADFALDIVGSLTVSTTGRSPMRIDCDHGAAACGIEIEY